MKTKRQNAILSIINEKAIKTHGQLVEELKKMGFSITQATVSRDIKELGLIKVSQGDGGSVYASSSQTRQDRRMDIFTNSVIYLDYASNMVVIKTYPGLASGVAASLDAVFHEKIMGSIAGDDTIFVMTRDTQTAGWICGELNKMLG